MKELKNYKQSCEELIEKFYVTYYHEEGEERYPDDYRIIGDFKHGCDVISIVDDFWQIEDIFIALNNKIPEKILFEWNSYQLYWHTDNKEGNPTNLINYFKQGKKQ